ncbi:hypothetical protein [Acidocella sp.]|uniref:hypothetical protein n=1 Tax=Acidocella sp. TaxID=50710 RepID=UPI0017BC605C|nr:hypothetical protein [Acidocella sp.]NNM55854.1 hypothetical protein [Acidocella sp.]
MTSQNLELVAESVKILEAAEARLKAGQAAHSKAQADLNSSFEASRGAVLSAAAGADIDPAAGAADYATAKTKCEFTAKVLDALETARAEAMEAHRLAEAESWRPVHEEGRRVRLQATRAAAKAQADLVAAEKMFSEGTALIERAHAKRFPRQFDGAMLGLHRDPGPRQWMVPREEHERALWGEK